MGDSSHEEKSASTSRSRTPNEGDAAAMDSIEPTRTADRPACFSSTTTEVLCVLTCTMAIGMTSMLVGSNTVSAPSIGRSLMMTTAEITWISSASALSSGAFLLFFGRLADEFGRKRLFVLSLFLFSVFCLATGFADDALTIDILNGVLGLFTASAVPPAVGILGNAYDKPSARKNKAFACFSGGNPLGFVFGTIFGGIATSLLGWRASFWLLAIIFLVFTVIAIFTVPKDSIERQPFSWETVKGFDLIGTLFTVAGIGMFSAALSLGDTAPDGWRTPYVLVLLIVGLLFIIAFIFWEMRFSKPLMPMWIWKDRNFSLLMVIIGLGFVSFTPVSFFASLYFQDVWHRSAITVALYLLPMAINGILVNIAVAQALHRISNKLLLYIGTGSYALACLLFALNRIHNSYWTFCFPGFIFLVVGADIEFNVANMYVMSSMPPSEQSTAGGIFQTVTKLCNTIGLGLATAIFNSIQQDPSLSNYWDRPTQAYAAVFWTSFAGMVLSIMLVPLLVPFTQGGKEQQPDSIALEKEKPRVAEAGREEATTTQT